MKLQSMSKIGFAATVVGIALLMRTGSLFSPSPAVVAAQALAAALMVWARLTFGRRSFHAGANPTAGGLVTGGPYKYVRNPIYTAVLMFVWAGVAANFSLPSLLFGILISLGTALRIHAEEHLLGTQYPAEYPEYASKTSRVIPLVF